MFISTQELCWPLPRLRYGNSTIEYKVSCKCLGLTIDNRLSWQEHPKNVCDSFSKKVSVLKQIKLLPKPVFQKNLLHNNSSKFLIWYCSLGLLSYIKRLLAISFNDYTDTCIDPLRELIVKSRVNYNFRQSANIEVPRLTTEIGQSSFMQRAALCWNLLHNSCQHSSSLGYFKKFLKENKNLLNAISFDKASCSVSYRSAHFINIFRSLLLMLILKS